MSILKKHGLVNEDQVRSAARVCAVRSHKVRGPSAAHNSTHKPRGFQRAERLRET